jgi:hypothetical protein
MKVTQVSVWMNMVCGDRYQTQAENLMLKVEIFVKGWIDEQWAEWLGGLMISPARPDLTVLTGVLPDQAAVYGIISRMRDLGFELSSVSIDGIRPSDLNADMKGENSDGQ